MEYIPTINEPEELKRTYKEMLEGWGFKDFKYDTLEAMEFKLLDEAYKNKFGKGLYLFYMDDCNSTEEYHLKIRKCIETGTPYKYPELQDAPEGVLY